MISMCIYRVKTGKEKDFEAILARHGAVLHGLGLTVEEQSIVYRGRPEEDDPNGEQGPFFVEFITWKDDDGPHRAHELPEVAAIWEPMGALCEERGGRPSMEFPHVEKLDLRPRR